MGIWHSEGGLRRRMPLRKAGGSSAVGASSFGGRAMRYYRLWIYTCNTVLLAGALAFCGAASRTLIFDYRRSLIPNLALYQPTFLYAYFALATQGGAIQVLGCVAAVRLSEKLLNAYWLVLLVLLFGDIILGAFWTYKFEKMCQELRPALRIRFQYEYGTNQAMATLWDRLQQEEECCGVTGPDDFGNGTGKWEMPVSCCTEPPPPPINGSVTVKCAKHHQTGCEEKLLLYMKQTASILAILGYCVLAFLKLCFLGILRYEIKEMIQKIRILQAELQLPNVNGAVPGAAGMRCEDESERESLLLAAQPESTCNFLSSPPSSAQERKNPNGNNNYEMREYRRSRETSNI